MAVVQAFFQTPPFQPWTKTTLHLAPALTGSLFERLEVAMVLSAEPPGLTPLRI